MAHVDSVNRSGSLVVQPLVSGYDLSTFRGANRAANAHQYGSRLPPCWGRATTLTPPAACLKKWVRRPGWFRSPPFAGSPECRPRDPCELLPDSSGLVVWEFPARRGSERTARPVRSEAGCWPIGLS